MSTGVEFPSKNLKYARNRMGTTVQRRRHRVLDRINHRHSSSDRALNTGTFIFIFFLRFGYLLTTKNIFKLPISETGQEIKDCRVRKILFVLSSHDNQ